MGGSGGGTSGAVDYPQYMKDVHTAWLGSSPTYSVNALMNTAWAMTTPYANFVTISPDTAFFEASKTIADYSSPFLRNKELAAYDLAALFSTYMADDSTRITNAINAESVQLDYDINTNILPKFKAGLTNINAVMSSTFVLGEALIWDSKAKEVAKHDAKIRLQRLSEGTNESMARIGALVEWKRVVAALSTEQTRMYITARTEIDAMKVSMASNDALWDLELYQYGTQVMASIAGAATAKGIQKDKGSQALSGALSGAATGAMVTGTPMGAAAGAVIGGVAGMLA